VQVYHDVPGETNEQPFHLDGVAPWFGKKQKEKWTCLSLVVLMCDAPSTVLGTLLPDFWNKSDEDVSDYLNEVIAKENRVHHPIEIRRAGHVVVFPQGKCFLVFFFT